jgi:hypothetical protein
MIKIVCVLKTEGSKIYNPEWVYKLENTLKRNISIPFEFVCLSDIPLRCNYVLLDSGMSGWWNKLQLFKPGLFTDETLYFDLDIIISKSLDRFIENLRSMPFTFLMANEPPMGIYNSSIMYWKDDQSHLYKQYISNPEVHHEKYRSKYFLGDQAFIQEHQPNIGFLNDCVDKNFMIWTKDIDFTTTNETGMVLFLGKRCKPHLIPEHSFIKQHWN